MPRCRPRGGWQGQGCRWPQPQGGRRRPPGRRKYEINCKGTIVYFNSLFLKAKYFGKEGTSLHIFFKKSLLSLGETIPVAKKEGFHIDTIVHFNSLFCCHPGHLITTWRRGMGIFFCSFFKVKSFGKEKKSLHTFFKKVYLCGEKLSM